MKNANSLRSQTKIVITASENRVGASFGKGLIILLRGVTETGSLNKAAKKQHIAYSKAWRMVKKAEDSLGFDLLKRHGGAGSKLTEEGAKFLDLYEQFEKRISEYSKQAFEETFKDFKPSA